MKVSQRTVLVQLNSLDLGGTQLNAVDFARAVEGHGYRSVLYGPLDTMPTTGPSLFDVTREKGVQLEGYWPSPSVIPGRAVALNKRAHAIGADIVHVYGAYGDPRSAYWGPCLAGRRPLVHTIYEMWVDPYGFQNSSLIVGTGYLRDELAERPGPTTLISPPVDTAADSPNLALRDEFRSALGHLGHRRLITIVSRLDLHMKSFPIETAIRSMRHLEDLNATLIVVGTGSEAARLQALGESVNRASAEPLVHFVGPMADPRAAYAAADVMLGMGGSAARSLAFGQPLIVQGERGTAELFTPLSAASLFRRSFWSQEVQDNPDYALAQIVRSLLMDDVLRVDMGEFGRSFALESFSLDAMATRLADVYQEALAAYGSVPWVRDLRWESPRLLAHVGDRLGLHRRAS